MYRNIETSFWDDPKVKQLPASGRFLFLYLITNRHSHVSGLYVLPPVIGQYETGLKPEDWNTLCHTLSEVGLARFDHSTEVVWVINMFRYQGRGQKNDTAAAKHLESLHKSILIKDFLKRYPTVKRYVNHRVSAKVYDRGSEVGVQEQDQEQDQEQENTKTPEPVVELSEDEKQLLTAMRSSPMATTVTTSPKFIRATLIAYGEKLFGVRGVVHEVAKMVAWLAANPRKRYKDWGRFVHGWLDRAEPPERPIAVVPNGKKVRVADVPPGHPCHGRKAGEEWVRDDYAYRLTRDGMWNKAPHPDGAWGPSWERVPLKEEVVHA